MKLSTDFQHFSTILIATHTTFVDSWRRMWMDMSGIFCCDPISICDIWVNESYWNVSWRPNLSLHFGYIVSSWSEWKQWAPNPSLFKTKIFPTAHHLHSIQFAYTRTPSYLLCTVDRYIYIYRGELPVLPEWFAYPYHHILPCSCTSHSERPFVRSVQQYFCVLFSSLPLFLFLSLSDCGSSSSCTSSIWPIW